MLENKEIIEKINEGFAEGDTEKILLYVADDIRWEMAGGFTHVGKDAFRKEIDNDNFEGTPTITIKTIIAEGDYVGVEGELQCNMKSGSIFNASFFDIYRLEDGKIKEMRSYVVEKK